MNDVVKIGVVLGLFYLWSKHNQAAASAAMPEQSGVAVGEPTRSGNGQSADTGASSGGGGGGLDRPASGVETLPRLYQQSFDPFDSPFFNQSNRGSYREEYPVGPGVIVVNEPENQ